MGRIKLITRRREPLYYALVPFGPEEEVLLNLVMERISVSELKERFPEVVDLAFASLGTMGIVQIEKGDEERPREILRYLLESDEYLKIAVVVDTDIDIRNLMEVNWALTTRVNPERDVLIFRDMPASLIDPAGRGEEIRPERHEHMIRIAKASKMGIDATKPLKERERFEKVDVPKDVRERVRKLL